jgi:hypothetical protein
MKNILPLLLLIAVFTSCVKDRSSIPSGASVKSLVLKADTVTTTDSLRLGLIAYYPFNGNVVDSSGNGNNGTPYNLKSVANRFGTPNSAYCFDGSSSYISIKDNVLLRLNSTDFTINYWIDLEKYIATTGSSVLSKNNGPFQNGWNTSVTGYGSASTIVGKVGRAFYNVSGGDDPFAVGDKIIPTQTWTMITVQYTLFNHTISFYVNGVFDTSVSNIPTPNPLTNANLLIGKNSYNDPSGLTPPYYVKGMLDDIRIYRRALSSSEILRLYNLKY